MGCPHCRYPFTLPPKGVVIRMEPIPTSTFTRECSNCGSLFAFEVRQIRGPAREDFPRQKVEHNGGSKVSPQGVAVLAGATESHDLGSGGSRVPPK